MYTWRDRLTRRRVDLVFDAALAAALTYTSVALTTEVAAILPHAPTVVATARVVAFAHGVALVARRRYPVGVLAACLATAVVYAGIGFPAAFLGPATLVAMYTVGARRQRRVSLAGLVAAEVTLVATLGVVGVASDASSVLLYALLLGGAWLLDDDVGERQAAAQAHADRAAQLERAREDLARYAVTEERLRIARELHDIVAHSMSVIAVHAGSGRLVADDDPVAARAALRVIEETTRAALAEMRQLLSVLRHEGEAAGDGLAPTPGLRDLHHLVAQVVASGVSVDVRVDGEPRDLPPGVDLSAYRIVQEALTNVVKHVGRSRAEVLVRYGDGELGVEVVDLGPLDGHPTNAAAGSDRGHGMVGMRERVALYGGLLQASPQPDGGFRVAATLPYHGRAR